MSLADVQDNLRAEENGTRVYNEYEHPVQGKGTERR